MLVPFWVWVAGVVVCLYIAACDDLPRTYHNWRSGQNSLTNSLLFVVLIIGCCLLWDVVASAVLSILFYQKMRGNI